MSWALLNDLYHMIDRCSCEMCYCGAPMPDDGTCKACGFIHRTLEELNDDPFNLLTLLQGARRYKMRYNVANGKPAFQVYGATDLCDRQQVDAAHRRKWDEVKENLDELERFIEGLPSFEWLDEAAVGARRVAGEVLEGWAAIPVTTFRASLAAIGEDMRRIVVETQGPDWTARDAADDLRDLFRGAFCVGYRANEALKGVKEPTPFLSDAERLAAFNEIIEQVLVPRYREDWDLFIIEAALRTRQAEYAAANAVIRDVYAAGFFFGYMAFEAVVVANSSEGVLGKSGKALEQASDIGPQVPEEAAATRDDPPNASSRKERIRERFMVLGTLLGLLVGIVGLIDYVSEGGTTRPILALLIFMALGMGAGWFAGSAVAWLIGEE